MLVERTKRKPRSWHTSNGVWSEFIPAAHSLDAKSGISDFDARAWQCNDGLGPTTKCGTRLFADLLEQYYAEPNFKINHTKCFTEDRREELRGQALLFVNWCRESRYGFFIQ